MKESLKDYLREIENRD